MSSSKSTKNKKYVPAFKKPVVLSLEFTVNYDKDIIAKLLAANDLDDGSTPFGSFTHSYDDVLSQCLINNLIDRDHRWFFRIIHDVIEPNSNDVFEIENSFNLPKMSFNELREGSKITLDRGHGLKSRWLGLYKETANLFDEEKYKKFQRIKSKGYVECRTAFPNEACYQEYLRIKTNFNMRLK